MCAVLLERVCIECTSQLRGLFIGSLASGRLLIEVVELGNLDKDFARQMKPAIFKGNLTCEIPISYISDSYIAAELRYHPT